MTTQTKKYAVWGIVALLAVSLLVYFFGGRFGMFRSSLLSGVDVSKLLSKDVGLYEGYFIKSASGDTLRAGTGVTLTSNNMLYGTGKDIIKVEVSARTGSGTLASDSVSGVLTYDKNIFSVVSTGSLLPSRTSLKFDPIATSIQKDASGETGEVFFSIDSSSGALLKPTQSLFTLELKRKNLGNILSKEVSLNAMRFLDTTTISGLVPLKDWFLQGSALTSSGIQLPLSITTDGSYVDSITTIKPDGNLSTTETFYGPDGIRTKEIITIKDPSGLVIETIVKEYYPDGINIKKSTDTTYYPDGVTPKHQIVDEYLIDGTLAKETIRDYYPDGSLKSEKITNPLDGSIIEKQYLPDGRIAYEYYKFPDGSIKEVTYAYNPDGSYTRTTKIVSKDGETITEEKFDKFGNLISSTILSEKLATNGSGSKLSSTDGNFSVMVSTGSTLARADVSVSTMSITIFSNLPSVLPITDKYTVKIQDKVTGQILPTFNFPVDMTLKFDPSKYPPTRNGEDFKKLAVFYLDPSSSTWVEVPGSSFGTNSVTFSTRNAGSYAVGAVYAPKPVVAAAATYVTGGGGSSGGGGGGTGFSPTESTFTPTEKETLLPENADSKPIVANGPLNFSKSNGTVYVPVRHVEFASGCEVDYEAGTKVQDGGKDYKGIIRPIARFALDKLQEPMKSKIPAGNKLIGPYVNQYAPVGITFSKDVTFVCNVGDVLSKLVNNSDNVQILAWDNDAGIWKKVGDASNFDKELKKYTVKLSKASIIAVFEKGSVVTQEKPSASICEDNKNNNRTPFKDVNFHWSVMYVCKLFNKGAIKGYANGVFQPDRPVTRAELLKIVMVSEGYSIATGQVSASFTDVNGSEWFAPYVAEAKKQGIISGYADGSYKPNNNVNRAEALKIIFGVAKLATQKELDEERIAQTLDADSYAALQDVSESSWFAPYVSLGIKKGVISGKADGRFASGDNMTRGEVSKVVSVAGEVLK